MRAMPARLAAGNAIMCPQFSLAADTELTYQDSRRLRMRSILLLVLGVPIPIILLIGLMSHF